MSQQPKQQLTLNPVQLLQITSEVLGQLIEWVERKPAPEVSHPQHDITARNSLFHARLLTNLRLREIIVEIQKRQDAERQKQIATLPYQHQLNARAAQVLHLNCASKTVEELWRDAGLNHYLDTGRP